MKYRIRHAFTLVELLVVIAIIGILVALLLPAVQAAREAARRLHCTNNLTQLILAVQNYEGAFRVYPSGTSADKGPILNVAEGQHHNWLIRVLPYFEETNTYNHVDFKVGVYHENNAPVADLWIPIVHCPSDPGVPREHGLSSYAGLHHDVETLIDVDDHGVFFLNSAVTYENVRDGSSQTIFLGEKVAETSDLGWMSGTRATLRNTGTAINGTVDRKARFNVDNTDAANSNKVGGFGSYHPGGSMFAFGDGHVSFLSQNIDEVIFRQLGHRADGKLLSRKNY
jgi:prepilin-type N-terminal cleavage/methylation domain-containing protein/prepilin-type processing-associated H-X9-DG protein